MSKWRLDVEFAPEGGAWFVRGESLCEIIALLLRDFLGGFCVECGVG